MTGFLWNTWLILTGIRSQTHLHPTEGCMTAFWRGDPGAEFPHLAEPRHSNGVPYTATNWLSLRLPFPFVHLS